MQVNIEQDNTKKTLTFTGTVEQLLKELKINPETVLVIRNKEVLTEDITISNNDIIELLSVVSGG
jgi:sulfur carrier protein